MAITGWFTGIPAPERFIPGRVVDQIVHRGFTAKRAPVLTRSYLWRMTVAWNHLSHDDRQVIDGLSERLNGSAEVIRVPWGFYQKKIGGGTGTPTVSGAHAAGATSVLTTGWTGTSPYLRSWDMVGFQTTVGGEAVVRVHRLTSVVSSGDLNMGIEPPLREALSGGASIYYMPSTIGGTDKVLQPINTSGYLEVCMALVDPSDIEMEAFPSNAVEGHYSDPVSLEFIEVIQDSY